MCRFIHTMPDDVVVGFSADEAHKLVDALTTLSRYRRKLYYAAAAQAAVPVDEPYLNSPKTRFVDQEIGQ